MEASMSSGGERAHRTPAARSGPVLSAGEAFLPEWWAADAGFDGSRRSRQVRVPESAEASANHDIDRPKIKVTARHPVPHSDVRDDALGGVWSIERQ
jgi:hypothetical protein